MLQGLSSNLFVGPDGRWLGGYTPACYRAYPFFSVKGHDGNPVLCYDEDSGLMSEEASEGAFPIMEGDDLSPRIKELLGFMQAVDKDRALTVRICDLIASSDLFVPWDVMIRIGDTQTPIQGLYTVDETKLRALADDQLRALMNIGALGVIYAQLLSKGQVSVLSRLADLQARLKPAEPAPDVVSELFDDKDDTLKFNF